MFNWTGKKRKEFEDATLTYTDILYSTALRLSKNKEEAEDLVQDTFLKAYKFYDKFEWGTNLKAWLLKILTNTFINNYKKNNRSVLMNDDYDIEPEYDVFISKEAAKTFQNPEDLFFRKIFAEDLDKALKKLPPEFRMVIILSDLEELSYKEISEILECPLGTVMSRLHRGRKLLQKYLIDHALDMGIINKEQKNAVEEETATVTELKTYRKSRR